MFRTVDWELHGRVAIIQFGNPPANEVNHTFLQDFYNCLIEIEQEEDIQVMIIHSSLEIVFATSDLRREQGEIINELFVEVIKKITLLPFPTIAFVSGYAIGDGFELALACDYRIATKSARFRVSNKSIQPILGESVLFKLIGTGKAKEFLLSRQIIGGNEAKRIGLVDQIIRAPFLMGEGMELDFLVFSKFKRVFQAGKRFMYPALLENCNGKEPEIQKI